MTFEIFLKRYRGKYEDRFDSIVDRDATRDEVRHEFDYTSYNVRVHRYRVYDKYGTFVHSNIKREDVDGYVKALNQEEKLYLTELYESFFKDIY